jgi:hypothetical protein
LDAAPQWMEGREFVNWTVLEYYTRLCEWYGTEGSEMTNRAGLAGNFPDYWLRRAEGSEMTLADFAIGDRVTYASRDGTRILHGTVTHIGKRAVSVKLDKHDGADRFLPEELERE